MSSPARKVQLKPAHGLSVAQVQRLRKTQAYWQRIVDAQHIASSAKANVLNEIAMIERMLGHG